ncbi:MAG TPA: HlyD family efflux transporter periplasmic adaptor subunit [Bacteroidales bacterium]|nr:HlyD family efflux transporter periplasmic adaptor subunit [Bacteroidales bacterium]
MNKGIIIAGIAGLFIVSCSDDKNKADAYGTFEATEVTVSSLANGRILWLKVEEGQVLDSNQLVGVVDTLDLDLKISQAKEQQAATAAREEDLAAQIAVQEQNKSNVLVDKARVEQLLKDGAATQKQLDDINASLMLIDKQVASIKSQYTSLGAQILTFDRQIAQLRKSIADAHIINPLKGTVLTKYAEPDEVTTFGKPLYKIADLSVLELRVYVSGDQLAYIKPGQQVEVRYDKDTRSNFVTEGIVSWISETAEFTPKTIQTKEERVNLVYAVKVRVKNDGSLKIGMPGEIKFMPAK